MKKLIHGLLLGLGGAVVALALWFGGVLGRWEYPTWAWRVSAFATTNSTTSQIKLILLDQASLDWGKDPARDWKWPWPRTVYGAVLDYCKRCGNFEFGRFNFNAWECVIEFWETTAAIR